MNRTIRALTAALSITAAALAVTGISSLTSNHARSSTDATGIVAYSTPASGIYLCADVAAKAGFSFTRTVHTPADGDLPQMVVAVAVAMAESSCNPHARYVNSPTSIDRGLWQINNAAHPDVSDACAYQPQCNANAAWGTISAHGTDWDPWNTYTGRPNLTPSTAPWRQYISAAKSAVSTGATFQLQSQGAGTCLDADSHTAHNGGRIFQWTCNGNDRNQQWRIIDQPGHQFILRNVGTGTCLDADSHSARNGGKIMQWSCNAGDPSQQWWFNGSGALNSNGHAIAGLQNAHGTCLDADGRSVGNGKPIMQWSCNGRDTHQQWN